MAKNFLRQIREMKSIAYQNRDKDFGKFLLELQSYVLAGEYSSYKKVRQLTSWVIEGYSDSYIADALQIKESTVRVTCRSVSNELYRLFGNDFFELAVDFKSNRDELYRRLNLVEISRNSASTYVLRDVLEIVGEPNEFYNKNTKMYECTDEVTFLKKYNLQRIKKDLDKLDRNKLIFLINVLNGISGTMEERLYLLGLLS